MNKAQLRQQIRQQKSILLPSQLEDWSQEICLRIMAMPRWKCAHTILLYHALPDEPNLQPLLIEGLKKGKQLLLPVVVGDHLVLKFYTGAASMQKGAFGILEPVGAEILRSAYDEIDLALVPGMAFDDGGHRLGRGRGYYDRLLPLLSKTYKLGVCFPFQCVEKLPLEAHDISMDEVCTA
ncbi:MAG: 5-formyltetrahydrofolate cyclo-ligase [Bacteroidaceae bacterium]|nr:5-formyltetrahydrofolate cyclo-ligase [Bacteroidaceae bacterium]